MTQFTAPGRPLTDGVVRLRLPSPAAHWALSLPGVTAVELRIGHDYAASQHVTNNAGSSVAGTVTEFVPGTGETFEDLRYVLERQPAAGIGPA
jgi:hypothetical protein